MKNSKLYILACLTIFVLFACLLFLLKQHSLTFFIVGEILVLLVGILCVLLYNQFIKPIFTINAAVNLLKEKDFNTRLALTGQANIDSITDVYNRMSETLREERIQNEEKNFFLELLIEASPAGIIIFTLDDRILKINPVACQIIARENQECVNKSLDELNNGIALSLSKLKQNETKLIQENGIKRFRVQKAVFLDKGNYRSFILIEELTKELVKTERASFEKVIRMMSHEVNNTVAAVNSMMEIVEENLKNAPNTNPAMIDSLKISMERNKSMNLFMANFASVVKVPEPKLAEINLVSVIENVTSFYTQEFNQRKINLEKAYLSNPFKIVADAILMEQVLINIIKNSIEAIEENGCIHIQIDDTNKSILIKDNGKGLTKEDSRKIFTPFYSTKTHGQGIGLTLVREILIAHNFDFSLETNQLGCTVFRIQF